MMTAGCSHYSQDLSSLDNDMNAQATVATNAYAPQDITPAAGGIPGSRAFSEQLAREYYAMAKYENDKAYDYKASKLYTSKAMIASKGNLVVPSKVTAYDLTPARAGELSAARKELITSLKDLNTPENAATLATAQTRYECWLERAEEAADETHYADCKSEFEAAMASLTMPAAGNSLNAYDIGFAQNTAIIDPAQASTLELIANFLKDPANAGYTATLTGFTAAQQGEFAVSLATTRVNTVREALLTKGIDGAKLNGFLSPAVLPEGKVSVALIAPPSQVTTKFVPVTPHIVSETPPSAPVKENPNAALLTN